MHNWRLKKGAEKRVKSGHPWVFSNELSSSPKGVPPGELITLFDDNNTFVATGYGNPHSLIAMRVLTNKQSDRIDAEFFYQRLNQARQLRENTHLLNASHRLVFAEGDYLPGLIVDRYFISNSKAQVFVVQASTAGMESLTDVFLEGLKKFVENESSGRPYDNTAIIFANSSQQRLLEGLKPEAKRIYKDLSEYDFSNLIVDIQSSADPKSCLEVKIDILGGQKTGYFLDQRENIKLATQYLDSVIPEQRPLRVLDLCCYVGQWSLQIANWANNNNVQTELHLFDTSEAALKLATENVERNGGMAVSMKGDVLKTLNSVADNFYDVVICDPPAFIKKKKDLPTGQAAYLKLNKEAIRKVRDGGLYVSCSCSGLFTPEDFKKMLARISYSQAHQIQWIAQGFHSPDHPQRLEFQEGTYLKSMMGFKRFI